MRALRNQLVEYLPQSRRCDRLAKIFQRNLPVLAVRTAEITAREEHAARATRSGKTRFLPVMEHRLGGNDACRHAAKPRAV